MRMCLFMRCSHSRMPVVVHTPPEECEQEQSARASRCKTHCWGGRRLWVQQCVFRLQKITKGLYIQPFSKVISIVSSPFSDGQKTTRNQIQALGDASNFGITTERGDDQPPAITTVVILPLRYLLLPAAPTSHHGIQLTHRPFREQVCIHRPRREPPPALSSPLPSPPPHPIPHHISPIPFGPKPVAPPIMPITHLPLSHLLASTDPAEFSGRRTLSDVNVRVVKARKVLVVSGAGISCSSGIPVSSTPNPVQSALVGLLPFCPRAPLPSPPLPSTPSPTHIFSTATQYPGANT